MSSAPPPRSVLPSAASSQAPLKAANSRAAQPLAIVGMACTFPRARDLDGFWANVRRGRDAIRAFYEGAAGTVTMKRTGPVRVAGREAATPLVVLIGAEGERKALDVISAMTFDEDGKITSMRAFWSFDAMRPATDEDLIA